MSNLLSPFHKGAWHLANRVAMAPLTRSRALPGNVVGPLQVEYYRQRASAGLIVSEVTQISPEGQGYPFTPGIHSPEQQAAWRQVTDAVHAAGGRIVAQLWHVGRVSHPVFQPGGALPVAPSALAAPGKVWTTDGMLDYVPARALETGEIAGVVRQYAHAAQVAKDAGFDGVEIHGANGYLVDQFLRDGSNLRTDEYGGSIANRTRFALEVVDAVAAVWGAERTGIRLSPMVPANGAVDSDPVALFTHVVRELAARRVGFIHIREDVRPEVLEAQRALMKTIRATYEGTLIVNGGYDKARADEAVAEGRADLVAVGVPYIANPDLVERFAAGAPLATADRATFYGGTEKGYTDYPRWDEVASKVA